MFRAFRTARRKSSHFALALALAGGVALGSTAFAPAAYAQDQDYSEGFVEVYQPAAALTQGDAPDYAGLRAQLPAVHAAIQTPDDRMAAGNLTLIAGQNLDDDGLRRQGLEMMIASGKVAPEQLGSFHWYVANFAYNAGEYAAARTSIDAALANGYVDSDDQPQNDPEYIYMQSYIAEGNPAAALAYLTDLAETRQAAGNPLPERYLLRGLQDSYDAELAAEATDVSVLLLQANPTRQNWINTLQVVSVLTELEPAERVDLARLMLATDALTQRPEFVRFAEDLDPRIMGGEVLKVLQAGMDAGEFAADDPYYVEVRGIAEPRAAEDRRQVATYVREGEGGDARDALATGDVLYSLEDYTQAARFYQLAAERGLDSNTANTRLGIALTKAGDYPAAKEAFASVNGTREPMARLWSVYVDTLSAQ
ncbi:MAG: hypothetical protein JY451_13800 [Erythrobacter sp.]|nr:MAG: hypothetical protein JY451_13800 [Erythrobacter sp.]